VTCNLWDVVVVPFPFSEKAGTKRRPALVLSRKAFNASGHVVLAMITTSAHHAWPGDVDIEDKDAAGLPLPCIVRLKLFTLDARLLTKRIGALSASDRRHVTTALKAQLF